MTTIFPTLTPSASKNSSRHSENLMIQQAISMLEQRMFKRGPYLQRPKDVCDYLRLKLAGEIQEVFAAIFLDSRHRVVAYEPLFYGSIESVAVYPRRILQRALEYNCAAIIVAHNHPSGDTTPSECDVDITKVLNDLLPKMNVRFLDHFIIGKGEPYSFAEAGLI
ncbi:JAB domain-containing protein [Pseudomonas sp. QTF5]|uniref:JAB domain-containing protein n=1 Tax=Pseudomonas sp. QTF5 TaxID=1435425 RepID=UPI0004B90059|nr:JAB domain-containing protein [Pseudomonas sp. QTF5]